MPLAPPQMACHAMDRISSVVGARNCPSRGHCGQQVALWSNAWITSHTALAPETPAVV